MTSVEPVAEEWQASDDEAEAEGEQVEEAPAVTPVEPVAEDGQASDDEAEAEGEQVEDKHQQ